MFLLLWGMVERKARRAKPRRKVSKEEMEASTQEMAIPAVIESEETQRKMITCEKL